MLPAAAQQPQGTPHRGPQQKPQEPLPGTRRSRGLAAVRRQTLPWPSPSQRVAPPSVLWVRFVTEPRRHWPRGHADEGDGAKRGQRTGAGATYTLQRERDLPTIPEFSRAYRAAGARRSGAATAGCEGGTRRTLACARDLTEWPKGREAAGAPRRERDNATSSAACFRGTTRTVRAMLLYPRWRASPASWPPHTR